jgi:tripeptidyl-peptidase-1
MKVIIALFCLLAVAMATKPKVLANRNGLNHPRDWHVGSRASPLHKQTFLIALKQRNLDVIDRLFWAVSDPTSPEYQNFLSIEEIAAIVDPPKEDKQRVVDWLHANGVDSIKDHGDALEVRASVKAIEKLFSTHMVKYTNAKTRKTIVRHLGKLIVPSHVAEYIDLVSGLTEFPVRRLSAIRAKPKSPKTLVSIAPQSVGVFYNIGTAKVTRNSSCGVIEFVDQYFSPDDLSSFASQFNVSIPAVTSDPIGGTNDPTNPQVEAALDIEYALGIGINAQGWFWIEADNVWLYGFAVHMLKTPNVPMVKSISYGWNEVDQCEDGIG